MFHASISAAALSAGLAVASQTRFDVRSSGPLAQSGNTSPDAVMALSSAEIVTIRFKSFILNIVIAGAVGESDDLSYRFVSLDNPVRTSYAYAVHQLTGNKS
ncbi:hypothetical protein F4680DRAFT_148720 [Xylaria scruposa]|nr:hypothetical protein F4680DRAFT_148720 [Xylaria scruposa]